MRNTLMIAAVASGLALSGCATDPNTGQQRLNKTAIGAALGAGVGYYMERQAKQLEQQMAGTGVTVTPNANGNIDLVMPGNITFSFDDASLNPSFRPTLDKLASTLNEYNQNTITVAGHTDSKGSDAYNMKLSRDRAYAVANYLSARGVASSRINVVAYGESRPVADNSTEYGRQQNRRVELTINAPNNVR